LNRGGDCGILKTIFSASSSIQDAGMNDVSRSAELAVAHSARLGLYARQWLDAAAAADVVQEALVTLLSCGRAPDDPVAWMYTAIRRRAIDMARSAARRRADWFEADADAALDGEAAQRAMEQLPRELREIVVLRIWGGLGFVQIAGIAQVSVGTAHQRFAEALVQLKLVMEPKDSPWKKMTK
jgi:RNA polymerase sigma factor (sigma-70 family)